MAFVRQSASGEDEFAPQSRISTRLVTSIKATNRLHGSVALAMVVLSILITSLSSSAVILSRPFSVAHPTKATAVLASNAGEPIGTTEARVEVPLGIAPKLPFSALAKVKSLSATYVLNETTLSATLSVAEVRKVNDSLVELASEVPGRSAVVLNGNAFLVEGAPAGGFVEVLSTRDTSVVRSLRMFPICASSVSCASFTLSADEAAVVNEEKERLLEEANGRRLQSKKTWNLCIAFIIEICISTPINCPSGPDDAQA